MKEPKPKSDILLSVVIPAYKAQGFIAESLTGVKKVLDTTLWPYEVICVVDGKVDKTYEAALKVAKKFPEKIKVFCYEVNRGKGYAVRFGMKRAKGDLIGFIDAGGEISPESLVSLINTLEEKRADLVVGSKRHPESQIDYLFHRRLFSLGYLALVAILFKIPVNDTQAGIKLARRQVIEKILPKLTIDGFAFDIELISLARLCGFNKISEAPIKVRKEKAGASTMSFLGLIKAAANMFFDTILVFYRLNFSRYYQNIK